MKSPITIIKLIMSLISLSTHPFYSKLIAIQGSFIKLRLVVIVAKEFIKFK